MNETEPLPKYSILKIFRNYVLYPHDHLKIREYILSFCLRELVPWSHVLDGLEIVWGGIILLYLDRSNIH